MLPAGFLAPVFFFELYKVILLGIAAYLGWWKDQLRSILQFAGVKPSFADTSGFFAKFTAHLDLLSSFLGISGIFVVILLGVLLLCFFAVLSYGIHHFGKKQEPEKSEKTVFSNHVLVMITVTLSYYGWWLLVTPTEVAWDRHIFIGYILLEICSVMIVSFLTQRSWIRPCTQELYTQKAYIIQLQSLINYLKRPTFKARTTFYLLYRIFTVGYISLLLAGSGYNLIHTKNFTITFNNSAGKTTLLEAGQYIRNLPKNAEILGYGWWQAPVVAFASGRTFDNIFNAIEMRNVGPLHEKYLVIDSSAYYLEGSAYKNILSQYDHRLVFSRNDIYIYKLNSRLLFAYEEFNDWEKGKVSYSKIDFTGDILNSFVRNINVGENSNSGKWAQDVSGCLFKYNQEGILKINLRIDKLSKYDKTPIELRIYANRSLAYQYAVNHDGIQEIIVPLKNIGGETLEVTIICNSAIRLEGNSRQYAVLLNGMELLK
jgi:hypothetical protein